MKLGQRGQQATIDQLDNSTKKLGQVRFWATG